LLTECSCPAFAKHSDTNIERLVAASAKRDRLSTANNQKQEKMAHRNPGQAKPSSKEFRSDGGER
jgi:hypothetical protein